MPDLDPPDPAPGQHVSEPDAMRLTLSQRFELEAHSRLLDSESDPATLRNLAKLLLQSWYSQKAATAWVIRQGMRR